MSAPLYCAACCVPFKTKKNGVVIERLSNDGQPHEAYHADLLECAECGNEILKPAAEPWTESYKPDYDEVAAISDYQVCG